MPDWDSLTAELDAWQAAGRTADLWWRDDDTVTPTQSLDRLAAITARHAIPLHLAVIPARLEPDLAPHLRDHPHIHVLQHALAHVNHEPKPHGASEIGDHRPLALQRADLAQGWQILKDADLPNLLPVLVPPWNRIAAATIPHLPAMGYRALSTFGPRPDTPGPLQINPHLDPVRWKPQPHFRGEAKLLTQLVTRLQDARSGAVDGSEPTGILTHHLQTDADTWAFIDTLAARLSAHPATRWRALTHYLPPEAT